MNCDEAFDLMTHPTDHNSEELIWHLQLCPRCQQMKETLAPALEPLQEFLGDLTEDDELTEFFANVQKTDDQEPTSVFSKANKPFLSEESVRIAEQAATRLRTEAKTSLVTKQTPRQKSYQKRLVHAALILLAGFFIGWGLSIGGSDIKSLPSAANSVPSQQQCLWVAQRENQVTSPSQSSTNQASINNVVLSCVACHLPVSAE